jgi:hypothetical protein
MISTPFAAVLPHIIRLTDDRVVELCCPICNGNAGSSSPHRFFNGPRAVMNHIARIHKNSDYNSVKDLLGWTDLRVLTNAEYKSIEEGEYADIIQKREASISDGQTARRVEEKDSIPLPQYPHIVRLKNGKYVQLKCAFCNGTAQTQRAQYE